MKSETEGVEKRHISGAIATIIHDFAGRHIDESIISI